MPRELKPRVIDEVESPNGLLRVPVYFDRNEKDFFVEIAGRADRVRAESVVEVKKLASEMLAKAIAYDWQGIIAIDNERSWEERHGNYRFGGRVRSQIGASIEFEFERLERSPNPVQHDKWIYREHTLDFEAGKPTKHAREQRERNEKLVTMWEINMTAVILYDDETWAGLLAMKRAVDEAHAKLTALVGRKDLAERLRLVGKQATMPILPAAVGEARGRR